MTLELFISIFVMSSTAASVMVEIVKNMLDSIGVSYKSVPIAVITAFVVGMAETLVFYLTHQMELNLLMIVYSVCMGIANAVGATCGYDLTKKFIFALTGKTM